MERPVEEGKQGENACKFCSSWSDTRAILFREVGASGRVTLSDKYEVVDITLSRDSLDHQPYDEKAEDSDMALRLTWDGPEDDQNLFSCCQLDVRGQTVINSMHEICQNNYSKLRELCLKLCQFYQAKLIRVTSNPVILLIAHQDAKKLQIMQEDESTLLKVLSTFLSLDDARQLTLNWNRTGKLLRMQKGVKMKDNVIDSQFEESQSIKENVKAHFQQQQILNEKFSKAIDKLSEEISELRCSRELRRQDDGMEPESSIMCENKGENLQVNDLCSAEEDQMKYSDNRCGSSSVPHLASEAQGEQMHSHASGTVERLAPAGASRCTPSDPWTEYSSVEAEQFLNAVGWSSESTEGTRLKETIGFALVDDSLWSTQRDEEMPPKARCLDTILCLDASSSMGEQGFREMQRVACEFVNGIDDISGLSGIEENIAVVAFGGRSRIEHFLSNDYGSVRDSIENLHFGGRSPLFEALLISLCAVYGRGGTLNISGVHKIRPRLIIITDGIPSDETEHTTQDVYSVDDSVTIRLLQLMGKFSGRHNSHLYPRPIAWIPVSNANMHLINSLANIGGGKVVSSKNVLKLCKYQRIQVTIGKIFACIKQGMWHDTGDLTDDIKAYIGAFSGNLDADDQDEVLVSVKAKLEGKDGYDSEEDDPLEFENILELDDPNLPSLGARVVRGPHWKWNNQDTNRPGTVTNHIESEKDWIWVLWDNRNHNKYRFGDGDCYDVVVVQDQPRYIRSDMMIDIGCEVTRGPGWEQRYQDRDGGPGGVGTVIRKNDNGEVKVRWQLTHEIDTYRYGKDDKLDLTIREPGDILMDSTAKSSYKTTPQLNSPDCMDNEESTQDEWSEDSRWVWLWQDEAGQWRLYPEEDIQKMEAAYERRQNGSCLIKRWGDSCRVRFRDFVERRTEPDPSAAVERKVERKRMSEDDIVVMKALEKSLHCS